MTTSFTIPKDPGVLRAMSKYLLGVADAIDEPFCSECGCMHDQDVETVADDQGASGGEFERLLPLAAEIKSVTVADETFDVSGVDEAGAEKTEAEVAFGTAEEAATIAKVETVTGTPIDTNVAPPPPAAATYVAPAGVELDDDGLPWDARINTASKLKLKKEGTWKLTRNIDPALVADVREELRAAMAASPANPVEAGAADVPPQPSAVVQTAAPVASGEISQPFPLFCQKVTAAGLTPEVVLAAVNQAGLASTVLLATRPDLIPTVEAILFPAAV